MQLGEGSTKSNNDGTFILQQHLFYTKKIQRTIHLLILVHLSQSLPGNSRRIAHTLLAIDSFLVVHCIQGIIRGPNLTLNH